jgi:hypothetical protein
MEDVPDHTPAEAPPDRPDPRRGASTVLPGQRRQRPERRERRPGPRVDTERIRALADPPDQL